MHHVSAYEQCLTTHGMQNIYLVTYLLTYLRSFCDTTPGHPFTYYAMVDARVIQRIHNVYIDYTLQRNDHPIFIA